MMVFRLLKECLVPSVKSATEIKLACPTTNTHLEDILVSVVVVCVGFIVRNTL